MQQPAFLKSKALQRVNLALTAFCIAFTAASVMAGADTTFGAVTAKLTAWSEGSMGNMFSLGTLVTGLGIAIVRQTLMPVAVAVGIAAAANWGPTILTGIASAVF